jgi:hypothetical protein
MKNSLQQIKKIAEEFLWDLEKFQEKIAEIKRNNPNNLEESPALDEFYKIFNETFLNEMVRTLHIITTKKIKEELCEHDFVWDRIEAGVEEDMIDISYCKHCEKMN